MGSHGARRGRRREGLQHRRQRLEGFLAAKRLLHGLLEGLRPRSGDNGQRGHEPG